jgi:hypothetical protein
VSHVERGPTGAASPDPSRSGEVHTGRGKAIAALALGILSIAVVWIGVLNLVLAIPGFILAIALLESPCSGPHVSWRVRSH